MISGISETLQNSPGAAVVTLFGAGVLTSLTPCIYPMIPITAGLVTGSAGGRPSFRRSAALLGAYVVGLALLYATMGLVAGLTGQLFGTVASNPWARIAIANLLLVYALAMFDVIPILAPQRISGWAASLPGGTLAGAFALGATSGIVAAPCGAPAFAAVLTWVAATRSGALGFLYLFAFSLGLTAILVVVGLFAGSVTVLPRSGSWLSWVKRIGGMVLLVMAQYYLVQAGMVF